MLKLTQTLAASALMTLILSACASIETRGLPKCSGHDRRPLNSDLWAWQGTRPSAQQYPEKSDLAMRYAPVRKQATLALEALDNLASAEQPRWDIASSEKSCG